MCKIETILFDVKKQATSEIGYGGVAGKNAIVVGDIDGVPHLLNLCSQNYELIPNSMVFPEIEKMLNEMGVEYTTCYSHRSHTRFYADYTLHVDGMYIGTENDRVTPLIHVEHSYDSSLKFKMEFGIYRFVCGNGLKIPFTEKELKEIGVQSIEMSGKHSYENMQKSFADFSGFVKAQLENDVFKKVVKKYEVMFDAKVENLTDRLLEVISTTGVFDKKLAAVAEGIVNYEAKLLGATPNEWLVYNAINALIFDDEVNSKPIEERRKLDTKVFESISKKVFVN